MTEYEILSLAGDHVDTIVSLLQWWAGITLGVLVGVHVIRKDLNGLIAGLLVCVYIAFTMMISVMSAAHAERLGLLNLDLQRLSEEGVTVSQMTQSVIEMGGPPTVVAIFAGISFFGLSISTVIYVIYCLHKKQRSK